MQIHEITSPRLDEGVGSFLGGLAGKAASAVGSAAKGVASTASNFKTSYNDSKMAQHTADIGAKVTKTWNNYARQLKAMTPDPGRYDILYKQALTAFVQKNLLAGQSINTLINKQEINHLIDNISSYKDSAQVASLFNQLVRQAALSQPDVTAGTQQIAKVVSTTPAVIEYRGQAYTINNNGAWANQKTGKVPDESFQAFLDQELNKAGGSAPTTAISSPTKSAATAPAKPAATAPAATAPAKPPATAPVTQSPVQQVKPTGRNRNRNPRRGRE